MALLKALRGDEGFHNKLKDVALDDCKVFLLRGVAGKKPTTADEEGTIELEGADTISEALQAASEKQAGQPAGDKLFIRVRLPSTAPRARGEWSGGAPLQAGRADWLVSSGWHGEAALL
jgi:hypothetical protein